MLKIVQQNWAPEQGNTCANDAWSVSSNKYLHVCYMTLLPEAAGLDAGAFPFRGLML